MSRIALCADIHLGQHLAHAGQVEAGLNERARMVVATLRAAYDVARARLCDWFIVAGDLFDTDKPSPQMLDAALRAMRTGPCIAMLRGNHDMHTDSPGDNAMAVLRHSDVTVFEKPGTVYAFNTCVAMVPFQSGQASEWLPSAVAAAFSSALETKRRVLVLHLGIRDETMTQPWAVAAHDAIDLVTLREICREHSIDLCVAGNWHSRKVWRDESTTIVQIGALCPTGWDNPGPSGYGTCLLYDSVANAIEVVEVAGPRFLAATTPEELDDQALACVPGCTIFARLKVPPAEVVEAKAKLDALGFHVGDVQVDTTQARVQARNASEGARSAGSLIEAVTRYVERAPGIDPIRGEVLSRVVQYLGLG